MHSYAFTFCVSLLSALVLTPLVRRLGIRVGAVTPPRARDIHDRAVPRLGGVAIAAAFFASLLALGSFDTSVAQLLQKQPSLCIGLALGGAALGALGLMDDTLGVRAHVKLGVQLVVACFAYWTGFRIEAVSIPFIGVWEMGVFALPITALWIVGIVNAVNLIDGLDGLAAGVIFFAALTNFVIAVIGTQVFVAVVMAAIMGAMVGFLFYNFNPAHIFMGDSGSYFLGYLLATASLTGAMQKTSTAVSLLVPMVALGVPIFDTLFSMLRRTLERRSVFSPDRGHVHHRLIDMGITHRRAVILLYGVSVLLMVSAIAIALGRSWESGAALLVASVVITALIRFVGYFEYVRLERRARSHALDTRTLLLRRELPELVTELAQPSSADQIWGRLTAFARACGCAQLVLVAHAGAPARRAPDDAGLDARDLDWTRFELGEGGHVSFGFAAGGALSARADILLQLAADAVDRALAPCARRPSTSRRLGVAVAADADEPGPSPSELHRRRAISG